MMQIVISNNPIIYDNTSAGYEVRKAVRALRINKTPGSDGIINAYLTASMEVMLFIYIYFFNKILNTGESQRIG